MLSRRFTESKILKNFISKLYEYCCEWQLKRNKRQIKLICCLEIDLFRLLMKFFMILEPAKCFERIYHTRYSAASKVFISCRGVAKSDKRSGSGSLIWLHDPSKRNKTPAWFWLIWDQRLFSKMFQKGGMGKMVYYTSLISIYRQQP